MSITSQSSLGATNAATKERRKAQASSFMGTLLEAYDFVLYTAAAALVFPKVLFSGMDPALGTTLAFVTLMAGYLARPVGGLLFGHFGDKIGRKHMLFITVLIMGVVSLAIGLMPTTLGAATAGILLTLIRVIQGLVAGGEWGGATLMSMEHSSKKTKGFGASLSVAGGPAGALLATFVLGIFASLPEEQFLSWGWRMPFLASIIVVLVALYLRYQVSESPEFLAAEKIARKQEPPILQILKQYRFKTFFGILLALAPLFLQAMLSAFMVPFLAGRSAQLAGEGQEPAVAADSLLFMVTIASGLAVLTIPVVGWLSDRFGRDRMLIVGSVLGLVGVWPMMQLFMSNDPMLICAGFILGLPIMQVAILGVLGSYLAELFSPTTRYTGLSLTYQVGSGLAAGTAPLVAQALAAKGNGSLTLIAVYYMALAAVAIISVLALRAHAKKNITSN